MEETMEKEIILDENLFVLNYSLLVLYEHFGSLVPKRIEKEFQKLMALTDDYTKKELKLRLKNYDSIDEKLIMRVKYEKNFKARKPE